MPTRTGPENENLKQLILELRKLSATSKAGLWSRLADDLSAPTRSRREVNLSLLDRETKPSEVIVVPGKVLGAGRIGHDLTVAAWSFSSSARKSIMDAKGKCITINELVKHAPKNIRIIG